MEKEFKIINRDVAYQGFFRLEKYQLQHTLFQGGWSEVITRELFMRGNCVAVLLYDPERDEVVLIEQFRAGAIFNPERAWLIEIVAGAIEEGETAAEVAVREAQEEAGCEIKQLTLINEFYTTPGGASERISLFLGLVDSSQVGGIHGLDHEHEDIRVSAVKFERVFQMLETQEIESGIPIIAIQWLYIHRDKVRRESLSG